MAEDQENRENRELKFIYSETYCDDKYEYR
jgi:hypothetical protein